VCARARAYNVDYPTDSNA